MINNGTRHSLCLEHIKLPKMAEMSWGGTPAQVGSCHEQQPVWNPCHLLPSSKQSLNTKTCTASTAVIKLNFSHTATFVLAQECLFFNTEFFRLSKDMVQKIGIIMASCNNLRGTSSVAAVCFPLSPSSWCTTTNEEYDFH